MHTALLSVLLVVTVGCASSQKISTGKCPDVQVKKDFDLSKYVGVWYEIEKNPVPFEAGLKCNTANYTQQQDYVTVVNTGIKKRNGQVSSIEGKATVPNKDVPAKLKVKFNGMPFEANYWVLDTDYTTYSIVYSCFSVFDFFNAEFLWILSRTPALENSTHENIYKFLDANNINRKTLSPTEQDC